MRYSSMGAGALKEAMGYYASGLTIIAGMSDGAPVGFTCQSFFSVSLDPPLVSFCVMKSSTSWPKLRSGRRMAINILSSEQIETCRNFGRSGVDRWNGVNWELTAKGTPVIAGALLCLDCSTHAEHEAGDHWLILAEVEEILRPDPSHEERLPLLYYKGNYSQFTSGS